MSSAIVLLTQNSTFAIISNGHIHSIWLDAAIAQLVERRIGNAEVTGSIPVSSLKIDKPGDTGKSYSNLCIYWFFLRSNNERFFIIAGWL